MDGAFGGGQYISKTSTEVKAAEKINVLRKLLIPEIIRFYTACIAIISAYYRYHYWMQTSSMISFRQLFSPKTNYSPLLIGVALAGGQGESMPTQILAE